MVSSQNFSREKLDINEIVICVKFYGNETSLYLYCASECRFQSSLLVLTVKLLGPVVQNPISANPGLTLNKTIELTQD